MALLQACGHGLRAYAQQNLGRRRADANSKEEVRWGWWVGGGGVDAWAWGWTPFNHAPHPSPWLDPRSTDRRTHSLLRLDPHTHAPQAVSDVLCVLELLAHLASKDFVDFSEEGEGRLAAETVAEVGVWRRG